VRALNFRTKYWVLQAWMSHELGICMNPLHANTGGSIIARDASTALTNPMLYLGNFS
jgi:hypothetical protein